MSRSSSVPRYRLHKPSGSAVVTLPDGVGNRRDIRLGRYGSPESRAEYVRVIAEWEAAGRRLPAPAVSAPDLTVAELVARFWPFAEGHYRRPDGATTSELRDFKYSLRPLVHLYGHAPVTAFTPLGLKAVRQLLIEGYDHPRYGPQQALSRGVINQRVGRIVRLFKWAVAEELVPETVHRALTAVRGLEKGRTTARESEPVGPVPDAFVEAVLPHVLPPVAAMVRLQRLTGMRPGEICRMRACDIDTSGAVWLYRPPQHKTEHQGKARVIALGPQAQEVVRPFLVLDTQAYLFSPARAMEEKWADMRRRRKSKVQPSQRSRRKRKPKVKPRGRYTVSSYDKALRRGCQRADRVAHEQDPSIPADQTIIPVWHPHQLRHAHATEVRRRFGLEAAQVALGHSQARVTEVYAQRDQTLAIRVAAEIG
jgi:integrase